MPMEFLRNFKIARTAGNFLPGIYLREKHLGEYQIDFWGLLGVFNFLTFLIALKETESQRKLNNFGNYVFLGPDQYEE